MNKTVELTAIFKGHVQGVGFRVTAIHYARQLNLNGYVRNMHDDSVELVAQGTRPELEALLHDIRMSSVGRYIFSEDISWSDVTTPIRSFTIRY